MGKKNKLEIEVHDDKALEVVNKVMRMFNEKYPPFDNLVFPDTRIPDNIKPGSRQHALMLFVSTGMDSMSRSDLIYDAIFKIAEKYGALDELFQMKEAGLKSVLQGQLGENIESGINNPVRTLKSNLNILASTYYRDPREIGAETIEETIKRICEFTQFRNEKAALLMKNYVRVGIWDFPETEIPIKIDRHVIRISIGAGVITFPQNPEKIRYDQPVKTLRAVYQKATKDNAISAICFDDAMWGVGSQMCVKKSKSYCDVNCPIKCAVRPWLDKETTWLYLKKETRRNLGESLFNFDF